MSVSSPSPRTRSQTRSRLRAAFALLLLAVAIAAGLLWRAERRSARDELERAKLRAAVLEAEIERLEGALDEVREASSRPPPRHAAEPETEAMASGALLLPAPSSAFPKEAKEVLLEIGASAAVPPSAPSSTRSEPCPEQPSPSQGLRQEAPAAGDGIAEDVGRALRELAPSPEADRKEQLRRLAERIGTGRWLLPILAPHFEDPQLGVLAVRHAGRLRGLEGSELLQILRQVHRSDREFVVAAAHALQALGLDAPAAALGLGAVPDGGLLALVMLELRATGVRRVAVLAAALRDGSRRLAEHALPALVDEGRAGRQAVLESLGALEPALVAPAVAALAAGEADELADLARRALASEPVRRALDALPLDQKAEVTIVAELLAGPEASVPWPWIARWLGRPADTSPDDLLQLVYEDPAGSAELAAAARRTPAGDPERATLAALLPAEGLVLASATRLIELAQAARPAHVPFLLTSLDLATGGARVPVAEALHRLGHEAGGATLLRLAQHLDPMIAAGAVRALSRTSIPVEAGPITAWLASPAPIVRSAALALVDARKLDLAPPEALGALGWADGLDADRVLAALARHPDGAGSRGALLRVLEGTAAAEEGAAPGESTAAGATDPARPEGSPGIADPDAVAWWLLGGRWPTPDALLHAGASHAAPAVRARAAEAIGRKGPDPGGAFLRALEALAADGDPRVRVHAASALGGVRHDLARARLVLLARDPEPLVREAAMLALGAQEPYHVIPVLRQAVQDPDPHVRNAARIALLRQGIADVTEALREERGHPLLGPRTAAALVEYGGGHSRGLRSAPPEAERPAKERRN